MPWKEGDGLPYDGFYNGRVDMMIANGTFEDYLPKIMQSAMAGKFSKAGAMEEKVKESIQKVEAWKKEWSAIPLEKRVQLRNRVVDDIEPKPVAMQTVAGTMMFLRAKPSENNNLDKRKPQIEKKIRKMIPSGAVTRDNNPLIPLRVATA